MWPGAPWKAHKDGLPGDFAEESTTLCPSCRQSHPYMDSDFRVGEVLLPFVAEGVVVEEHSGAVAAEEAVRHYIDGIAPDVA